MRFDGTSEPHNPPPAEYDQEDQGEYGEGSHDVGASQLDEDVMQMGFVGFEGRLAFQDAGKHHAEGVEYGHGEYGEGEGDQAGVFVELTGRGRLGPER